MKGGSGFRFSAEIRVVTAHMGEPFVADLVIEPPDHPADLTEVTVSTRLVGGSFTGTGPDTAVTIIRRQMAIEKDG